MFFKQNDDGARSGCSVSFRIGGDPDSSTIGPEQELKFPKCFRVYWNCTNAAPINFMIILSSVACRQKLSCTSVSPLSTSDVTVASSCSTERDSHELGHEKSSNTDVTSTGSSEKKYKLTGTKLIALRHYEGSASDDLKVRPGEYVYANLKDQIVPNWVWAYSPYRKRSGFIPEEFLREPVVTEIWSGLTQENYQYKPRTESRS